MPTISMTCASCGRGFKRRTRKGITTSCRHCGHVQPGPEGHRLQEERLRELEAHKTRRRERENENPPLPGDPPAAPSKATEDGPQPDPAAAGGKETSVPPHPDAAPPPPKERHPNLFG